MKRPLLSSLFALSIVVVLAVANAVAADAPRRSKLACGPERQKLPAGAQNYGTVEGQPTIMSPAFGKDMETFYAPLFEKIGCQPFTCEIETMGSATHTKCKCKVGKTLGMVITDTGNEAYTLSLYTVGRKKK